MKTQCIAAIPVEAVEELRTQVRSWLATPVYIRMFDALWSKLLHDCVVYITEDTKKFEERQEE